MKNALFALLLITGLTACDPSATQIQIVRNSTSEALWVYRFPDSTGVPLDTILVPAGIETEVYNNSQIGELPEESCPRFNDLEYANDTVIVVSASGKALKKDWYDEDNWESEYKNKTGTTQKCTIELFDADFQ